jgi:hypothetical protein
MKTYFTTVLLVLSYVWGSQAQTDCSTYYPLKKGTTFQLTMYDDKDKNTGTIDYVVKEATENSATMSYTMHSDKDKLIAESEYNVRCTDDGVSIDFSSLASPGTMEQYQDMEVDITGTDLMLPNNLKPGTSLPDANMLMTIKMKPITMKMTVDVFNRKVDGRESVTTPAGTYDCIVVSWDHESKMGVKISGSAKQWLAENVGMVKQENYNKKGKMIGGSILTAFNQ